MTTATRLLLLPTLADAETRYPVHEKELLAVIHSLKHWRHYLLGSRLTIHTDHHSLKFIKTQATLSQRQARWLETLEDFDYEIVYQPGKTNVVADALSRVRSDLNELTLVVIDSDLATLLKTAYSKDPATADLLRKVTAADPTVKDFTLRNGLLYVAKDRELLYIPADPDLKKKIFSDCHDSATAGHLGLEKTLDFIRRSFFWPSLATEVKAYVSSCLACQRNKPSNAVPAGLLQPLEIPDNPWDCVSMDFVVQLPRTARGFDAIFVVVDKLTKYAHFIPTTTDVTADTTARLFFDNIFTYHGLPIKIVSDRDAKFISNFWQGLFALLGTKLAMSTAFHPQTDGQTERMNRTLEQMLRFYVSYRQDDWDLYLPTCQFAVNNAKQASTGETPFYLNHGRHPGLPHTLLHPGTSPVPAAETLARDMAAVLDNIKDNLRRAQESQARYADEHREHRVFSVGEEVLLSTANFVQDTMKLRPSRKLGSKYVGPFKILQMVSPVAAKLERPTP